MVPYGPNNPQAWSADNAVCGGTLDSSADAQLLNAVRNHSKLSMLNPVCWPGALTSSDYHVAEKPASHA
jgi:hypothetical protein